MLQWDIFTFFLISARSFLEISETPEDTLSGAAFAFKVRWTRGVISCWEYYAVCMVRLKLIERTLMINNARIPLLL